MDMASVVREFLEENRIRAVRSVEISYRYHAEMEKGSRLSGCEIVMRTAENAVFVQAELPVSVRVEETRGVAKYLADLNKKRLEEDKQGYFDLDYAAGRIFFAIRVRQTEDTELLKEVADFCLMQLEAESEALLRVICEECEAARQEEEERRQEKEKEFCSIDSPVVRWNWFRRWLRNLPLPGFMKKRRSGILDDMCEMESYDFSDDYPDYDEEEPDAVPYSHAYRSVRRRRGSGRTASSGAKDSAEHEFSPIFSPRADRESPEEMGGRPILEVPSFLRRQSSAGHRSPSRFDEQDDAASGSARNSMTEEEFEEFVRRHVRREGDMPADETDPLAEETDEAAERDAKEMEGAEHGRREECVPHPAEEDEEDSAVPEEEDQPDGEEADEYPPLFFDDGAENDFSEPDEYDPEDEEEAPAPNRAKQNVIILPASPDGAEEAKENE